MPCSFTMNTHLENLRVMEKVTPTLRCLIEPYNVTFHFFLLQLQVCRATGKQVCDVRNAEAIK